MDVLLPVESTVWVHAIWGSQRGVWLLTSAQALWPVAVTWLGEKGQSIRSSADGEAVLELPAWHGTNVREPFLPAALAFAVVVHVEF